MVYSQSVRGMVSSWTWWRRREIVISDGWTRKSTHQVAGDRYSRFYLAHSQ
jgi:hypothetical protein